MQAGHDDWRDVNLVDSGKAVVNLSIETMPRLACHDSRLR
jgi:hypothetical protein